MSDYLKMSDNLSTWIKKAKIIPGYKKWHEGVDVKDTTLNSFVIKKGTDVKEATHYC